MSEFPLVSIIIVNFNGKHFLKNCFESLNNQTLKNFEVILVDNNSTDETCRWVENCNYHFVNVLQLDKNYGFGIANNRGFQISKGKYIVLLNNDTVLDTEFLANLIVPLQQGLCKIASPLILYKDRPKIIDKAGGHLFYPDGLNRGRGCGTNVNDFDLTQCEVFYPDGCASVFDRQIIENYGFFDEDFYLYGEDTDLGLRYKLSGFDCLFVPTSIVFHVHSGTAGKFSTLKAYYVERNRYFVMIKNFPIFYILISPLFTILRYLFQGLATMFGKGVSGNFKEEHSSLELLKTLIKANIDAFKMIPVMWKKRKMIRKEFKVGFFQFSGLLIKYFLSPVDIAFKD